MIILVLLGAMLAGFILWGVYKFAIYTLPCLAGFYAAKFAYDTGAGAIGAPMVFIFAALLTFVTFQIAYARSQGLPLLQYPLTIAFVGASMFATYNISYDLLGGVPSEIWRHLLAGAFTLLAGLISFLRLSVVEEDNA